MSQRQILALIGAIIIILPFLGLYMVIKQIIFVFIGLGVIVFAFKSKQSPIKSADTFSDSHNHNA